MRSGCQCYIYTHIKEVENSKSIFASRQLTNPFCFPGVHLALPSTIEERASGLERRYYVIVNFVLYFSPRIDCRKDIWIYCKCDYSEMWHSALKQTATMDIWYVHLYEVMCKRHQNATEKKNHTRLTAHQISLVCLSVSFSFSDILYNFVWKPSYFTLEMLHGEKAVEFSSLMWSLLAQGKNGQNNYLWLTPWCSCDPRLAHITTPSTLYCNIYIVLYCVVLNCIVLLHLQECLEMTTESLG